MHTLKIKCLFNLILSASYNYDRQDRTGSRKIISILMTLSCRILPLIMIDYSSNVLICLYTFFLNQTSGQKFWKSNRIEDFPLLILSMSPREIQATIYTLTLPSPVPLIFFRLKMSQPSEDPCGHYQVFLYFSLLTYFTLCFIVHASLISFVIRHKGTRSPVSVSFCFFSSYSLEGVKKARARYYRIIKYSTGCNWKRSAPIFTKTKLQQYPLWLDVQFACATGGSHQRPTFLGKVSGDFI